MSVITKILSLLSPLERKKSIIMLLLMCAGMLLETIGVGLVFPLIGLMYEGNLINEYPQLQPLIDHFNHPSKMELIIWILIGLCAFFLMKTVFLGFSLMWQMRFVYGVQASLSAQLFRLYLMKPYEFHLISNSSILIRNITTEVVEFNQRVLIPLAQLISESLVLLGIVLLLLYIEPTGTFIVVSVIFILSLIFYYFIKPYLLSWGEARQYHEGKKFQYIQQGLGAIKEVKLLWAEKEFQQQFNRDNLMVSLVSMKRATVTQLPRLWFEFLAITGLTCLVVVMSFQGKQLSEIVPFLGMFGIAAIRLMPSANRILGAVQVLRFGLPVINTLSKAFCSDQIPERSMINDKMDQKIVFSSSKSEIVLKKISYSYPEASEYVLNELNLTIRAGESLGFIGESGSGKSSLIDLILGLLTPLEGGIFVNGINIQQDLYGWQSNLGYVPQTIYLTDDSMRRNIAFGVPDDEINEDAVWSAITSASLKPFIDRLPNGLDTMVGERGVRLSGGQRQRIGIARALYHDPKVLVLDEATSALDSKTELAVMRTINKMRNKKTLIIVTHRMSTLTNCDRVIRLDNAGVLHESLHNEMVNNDQL